MLRMKLVTPSMGRGYGLRQFSTELKSVLTTAGVEGSPVLLLLEDFQVTNDAFLEMISSLLTSGEVPGLFAHEELEGLLAPLEPLRQVGGRRILLLRVPGRLLRGFGNTVGLLSLVNTGLASRPANRSFRPCYAGARVWIRDQL